MEWLLYNEKREEFWLVDEWLLQRLRDLSDDPTDDREYVEEFDELERRGWRKATPLTVAMTLGEVYDEDSLTTWVRRGSDENRPSSETKPTTIDLSLLLYEEVKRIAASNERMAISIESIAAHAHLLSPPMTVEQVATYAHVKPKTVYDWKAKGWIRPLADNAKPLLFERDEVRRAVKRVRGID